MAVRREKVHQGVMYEERKGCLCVRMPIGYDRCPMA
jgi:hypothetical protein